MPPSGVGRDLGRLKAAASPNEPSGSPSVVDSSAWAQSSISASPRPRQMERSSRMGAGKPA